MIYNTTITTITTHYCSTITSVLLYLRIHYFHYFIITSITPKFVLACQCPSQTPSQTSSWASATRAVTGDFKLASVKCLRLKIMEATGRYKHITLHLLLHDSDVNSSLKLEIHSTCSFQDNCSALPVIESIGGTVE